MIREFFEALRAECPEGFPLLLGAQHLGENAAPPRVVVVPTAARYAEPHHALEDVPDPDDEDAPARLVEVEAERRLTLTLHCWGEDLERADALVQAVHARVCRVAKGSIVDAAEEWEEGGQLVTAGVNVALQITLAAPVPNSDPDTRTILADVALRVRLNGEAP